MDGKVVAVKEIIPDWSEKDVEIKNFEKFKREVQSMAYVLYSNIFYFLLLFSQRDKQSSFLTIEVLLFLFFFQFLRKTRIFMLNNFSLV